MITNYFYYLVRWVEAPLDNNYMTADMYVAYIFSDESSAELFKEFLMEKPVRAGFYIAWPEIIPQSALASSIFDYV